MKPQHCFYGLKGGNRKTDRLRSTAISAASLECEVSWQAEKMISLHLDMPRCRPASRARSGTCRWIRFRAGADPYCLGGIHPDFSPIYGASHLLTVIPRCRCKHGLEYKLHVRKQSDRFRRGNIIQEAYRNLSELTDKGLEDTPKTSNLKIAIILDSCIFD